MNSSMSSRTWVLILIFVVIALIFSFVYRAKQESILNTTTDTEMMDEGSNAAPVAPKTASPPVQTKSYDQLFVEYDNSGRRIQFDIGCQAVPGSLNYRNGTEVMFDNRSGDARWISIGGNEYYLEGYGYKVITLASDTLPTTLLISCGSAVNVGQIHLQP